MSQSEDQLDCAGVGGTEITDMVFDNRNQERRSWRFCNSRQPRSEVVYFTQVSIIDFLILVSMTNLIFFTSIAKSQNFGFPCYCAQSDTHFQILS